MNERSHQRMRRITAVLWDILALNLVVAIAKLIYGARSGAIAITADGAILATLGGQLRLWRDDLPWEPATP